VFAGRARHRESSVTRRYHLHLPGLVYLGVTVLVGVAAIQNNLLMWALGLLVGALLASEIVSGWMLRGLSAQRIVPRHGVVGAPMAVRYALRNRNRFMMAFDVHVQELPAGTGGARHRRRRARPGPRAGSDQDAGPRDAGTIDGWERLMQPAPAWVMHIGPRETVHGEAVLWPWARGAARFDRLRIWTTFPLGIVRKSITVSQPQHTLVHPLLYEVRHRVLEAVAVGGLSGSTVASRRPEPGGEEYYGLREFRPGDSLRQIAWKRSAAVDRLVAVERTRAAPPLLRVVLDLTRPTEHLARGSDRAAARRLEERAISLAASIIRAAERFGFEIGLSMPGTGQPRLPIRHGHWHRQRMMAALASIDLDAPRVTEPRGTGPRERAGVIVVHPDRVEPPRGLEDAWHFSSGQLESLVTHPLAWDPQRPDGPSPPGDADATRLRVGADEAGR
jgi:uncharacterized protein (DUF58 family)